MTRSTRVVALVLGLLCLGVTAGCAGTVQGSALEARIGRQTAGTGLAADDVRCPDLAAKVGTSVTCTFTVQRQRYRTDVEVRAVDGDTVRYRIGRPRPAS